MKRILQNWSLMRFLRLAIGIFAFVQSFYMKDAMLGALAFFLTITALVNVGCCGTAGCSVNTKPSAKTEEIIYEEVDAKK